MTPPRRRTVGYIAGLVGAVLAGFGSHWVVPAAVKEAPAAQAAPNDPLDRRLQAIEQKQETILSEIRDVRETLGFVRGRLNMGTGK